MFSRFIRRLKLSFKKKPFHFILLGSALIIIGISFTSVIIGIVGLIAILEEEQADM